MHEDEKYVVFKRGDMEHDEYNDEYSELYRLDDAINDAVVIRTQDVFAVSGLRAYRDTMMTHLNLLTAITFRNAEARAEIAPIIRNLKKAVEYFTEVTIEAEDRFNRGDVKVPD